MAVGASRDEPTLEGPIAASTAIGVGYVEGKWVAEEVIYAASRATPLDGLVVRVGQLCGAKTGAWAASEWIPRMVKSASKSGTGCLPYDDRVNIAVSYAPQWQGINIDDVTQLTDIVPFDICAAALLDFLNAPCDLLARAVATHTIHLVHPRPVPWNDIATHLAHELGARLAPYVEWLNALERAAAKQERGGKPLKSRMWAVRLPPFFYSLDVTPLTGPRAMGFPEWDGQGGAAASPTLAKPALTQLGAEDVKKWIRYWRTTGFIQDDHSSRVRGPGSEATFKL